MTKFTKYFFLILISITTASANVSVVMTHVQSDYDQRGILKNGIDELLQSLDNPQVFILQNNMAHWLIPLSGNETINFSQYGEHNIKIEDSAVYIVGAQLGACLQFTIRDLIKNNNDELLEIMIDSKTVLSIEGELLSDKLNSLNESDAQALLHRYFSRTIFLESNRAVKSAKINIYWRSKLLGSLRDQSIKKPFKNPSVNLRID